MLSYVLSGAHRAWRSHPMGSWWYTGVHIDPEEEEVRQHHMHIDINIYNQASFTMGIAIENVVFTFSARICIVSAEVSQICEKNYL